MSPCSGFTLQSVVTVDWWNTTENSRRQGELPYASCTVMTCWDYTEVWRGKCWKHLFQYLTLITINGGCSLYVPVRSVFEVAVSITGAIWRGLSNCMREASAIWAQNRRGLQLSPIQMAQVEDAAASKALHTGTYKLHPPLVIFFVLERHRACFGPLYRISEAIYRLKTPLNHMSEAI